MDVGGDERMATPGMNKKTPPKNSGTVGTVGTVDLNSLRTNTHNTVPIFPEERDCNQVGTVENGNFCNLLVNSPKIAITVPCCGTVIKSNDSKDLMSIVPTVPKLECEEKKTRAIRFLVNALRHAEVAREAIEERAREEGIDDQSLSEAAVNLGVEKTLCGGKEFWWLRGPRQA